MSPEAFLLTESLHNKNDFKPKYLFNIKPKSIDEFNEQCIYKQTSPQSHFVKNVICTLPTETGRKTIFNTVFKVRHNDEIVETQITNNEELGAILEVEFGIVIE